MYIGWSGKDSLMESHADPLPAAPHPEEMKGAVTFKVRDWVQFTASGRTTPAGLVCAALLVCALLIPVVIASRRR
jgi:hypothetical protein